MVFPDAAQHARARLDALYEGDVETMEPPAPAESLDLVLCLDVLEHLRDPWRVVQRLATLLRPDGDLSPAFPTCAT